MANAAALYPRSVRAHLTEALTDTPVVLVHGPRQCGKTTLARQVGNAGGYAYVTFDDDVVLAAARADPLGFVGDLPEKTVLDEVQRVPALFTAIKSAVDRTLGSAKSSLPDAPPSMRSLRGCARAASSSSSRAAWRAAHRPRGPRRRAVRARALDVAGAVKLLSGSGGGGGPRRPKSNEFSP